MRPILIDLFCGAGGCTKGYQDAGFYVVGVDIQPQPRYVGNEFYQADAMTFLRNYSGHYDVIHASPPCQKYTVAQNAAKNADAHPDLVGGVRDMLKITGKPYVIENVVGAPLIDAKILCGISFGLNVRRHRLFESNFYFLTHPCQCKDANYYVIFGHEVRSRFSGSAAGRKNKIAEGRKAMGIDWMTRGELSQAIPPAYTKYIGQHLMKVLTCVKHL